MLIYINFNFDFLSLDNVDFENYFVNKLINMGRFLTNIANPLAELHIQYSRV